MGAIVSKKLDARNTSSRVSRTRRNNPVAPSDPGLERRSQSSASVQRPPVAASISSSAPASNSESKRESRAAEESSARRPGMVLVRSPNEQNYIFSPLSVVFHGSPATPRLDGANSPLNEVYWHDEDATEVLVLPLPVTLAVSSARRGATAREINALCVLKLDERGAAGQPEDYRSCPICLQQYEPREELRVLPCLHRYHKECIDTWLAKSLLCPVCKSSIAAAYAMHAH